MVQLEQRIYNQRLFVETARLRLASCILTHKLFFDRVKLFFLIGFVHQISICSQPIMPTQPEHLRAKGKAFIIQTALDLLHRRAPACVIDTADYAITAWTSDTEVQVRMKKLICLESTDSYKTSDIEVNLISGQIQPFDSPWADQWFVATPAQQKIIELVKRVTGVDKGQYAGYDIRVREDDEMIYVHISNTASFCNLYLDKITGKEKMDSMQGSYEPPPDFLGLPAKEANPWQEVVF